MDFQFAREVGYYFDRCIDLTFYNSDKEPIGFLKTPTRGLKPTVTIKGMFIEGGYAIDSYISIQNMAFDVDVAYISYIKAKMYYSGLAEVSTSTNWNQQLKSGTTIMYRVLYADQEKEPPNRCVRFQCVVASKDISLYNTPMYISGGTAKYLEEGTDANTLVVPITDKSNSKVPLKELCKELINIYNLGVIKNVESVKGKGKTPDFYDALKINLLEIDEPLENIEVELSSGGYTIGDFVRLLNSNATETDINGFSYPKFKVVIDRGAMRVSTPIPGNWKEIARTEGVTKDNLGEYYSKKYASVNVKSYSIFGAELTPEKETSVIPLNFVKSATRSECVVYIETLFDGRITPGCDVSIKSNAIMGKKFGSSKSRSGGSRILNYLDAEAPIVIRNTGKIEYLFSTTEDSYMKLQGPVKDYESNEKSWNEDGKALRDALIDGE